MARFGGYRAHLLPAPDFQTFTLEGTEIDDVIRAAALEGDGRTVEESVGIWEATTNLITNGGFETDTTGWTEQGSTTTRVTAQQKFGDAAGEVATDNVGANEGPYHAFTGAAATKYSVSAWVRGSGTVRIALYDNVSGKQASSAVTLTSAWQRIEKIATTGAASATFRVYVETDSQQNITFNVDGVQVEATSTPTPYVETDGGTATRALGRGQFPFTGLITEEQGWAAFRFRAGWSAATPPNALPHLMDWGDDPLSRIVIRVYIDGANVHCASKTGDIIQGVTLVKDTDYLVLAAWDAVNGHITIEGNDFTSGARTYGGANNPAANLQVGIHAGGASFSGDYTYHWLALGLGRPQNADIPLLEGFGNQLTDIREFPQHLRTTALWQAHNGRFEKVKGI